MASVHPSPPTDRSWIDSDVIPHLVSQPLPYIVTTLAAVFIAYSAWHVRLRKLPPILNAPGRFDMGNSLAKLDFLARAASLLKTATSQFTETPVRIATDTGNLIVLPPNYLAQEIRNEPNLSFFASSEEVRWLISPSSKTTKTHASPRTSTAGFQVLSRSMQKRRLV